MRRASSLQACGVLCLLALIVAVEAASTSTDPSSAIDKHRERRREAALLDQDAILQKAALRTGKSAGEILRLLSHLAERRGSPVADFSHHPSGHDPDKEWRDIPRPPASEGEDILPSSPRSIGSRSGLGGEIMPGHFLHHDDGRDGGKLSGDLDRLLWLSGFPAGKLGLNHPRREVVEEEAILHFLDEVAHHGVSIAEAGRVAGQSDARNVQGGKATAKATSRRRSTRTQVQSCGSCTWYKDTNGTLTIEGPQDCGSCTDTSIDLRFNQGITSIGAGAFDRTGLSHVTRLYLDNNQISSVEAGAFAGLVNLHYLYLYDNQISSVEAGAFAGLGNVIDLYLYGNQISSVEAGAFAGLGNLQRLRLYDNQISSVSSVSFAGLGNLTALYLSSNQISSVSSVSFAGLDNLQRLHLNGNQISSVEAGAFAGLVNLQLLELHDNQISSVEAEAFAGLDNLHYLRLDDNQISSLEAGAFAGLDNLRYLQLNGNPLVCKVALPPSLVFDIQYSWGLQSILPSNYSQLPNCSTTPATTDLHAWLAEVAASGRFSDPRCAESRSKHQLFDGSRADPGLFLNGGLGAERSTDTFRAWMCFANHPCLQAVGAGPGDRMCYARERSSELVLHPWGLDSELGLTRSCASG